MDKKEKIAGPIGSTYPVLTDISQYPQSPYGKAMADSMVTEMRAFQRTRFERLTMRDTTSLNGQEKQELDFYRQQLKWEM